MSSSADVMVASAMAIAILMVSTWVISIVVKNASIVDIVWGLGFVVTGWVSFAVGDGDATRSWVLVILVTLWGVRLAAYLARRNIGHGEDYRYKAMRKRYGQRFPLISFLTVFTFQGVLMWVVSLPLQLGQVEESPGFGPIGTMGISRVGCRSVLRGSRRCAVATLQVGPLERGPGDVVGSVALHAPPELLR